MSSLVVISSTMIVVSLIMAGAMAIAWASFGRPRHALSWSIAYLLYGLQVASVTIGALVASLFTVTSLLSMIFILVAAVLVVIGARQRAGVSSASRNFAVAAVLVFVVGQAISFIPAAQPYTAAIGTLFTACLLPIAAAAIWPRGRRPDPAEWTMISMLGLFSVYELVLGIVILIYSAYPHNAQLGAFYSGLYLMGLLPLFVANGVAAVLLLAFDLAARLRALASHDPLTGVLNRRGFYEAASRAIANGRRQRQSIAVAIADIDHFKSINDRFGHTAGDRTLHYICARLASGLRTEDLVGRIGGEEFALLLVNSTAEQAVLAMERIRVEVATGFSEDGAPVPVTVSFGVAAVNVALGHAEVAMAAALDEADRALYRSKLEGRNRTTLADAA